MASESYALTLWTFLQSEEAEHFRTLTREYERLDEAHLIAMGFSSLGNKPIAQRMRQLIAKTRAPVAQKTREELSTEADDLWARHNAALQSRPVS